LACVDGDQLSPIGAGSLHQSVTMALISNAEQKAASFSMIECEQRLARDRRAKHLSDAGDRFVVA
jgi:hypothetical protein